MSLLPADLKLLRRLLDCGHELESLWPQSNAGVPVPSTKALETLSRLSSLVSECGSAESPELQRLAFHTRDLSPQMSARHLGAILVPFERLLGRALRDDEFLVAEDDALEKERSTGPFVVIADNIRSAFNVGAILRTAECFGAERVFLTGYTPTPNDEKTARTAMGTQEAIAWSSVAEADQAIDQLKAEGYSLVALETVEGAEDLGSFQWPEKSALLLGNERFGVDRNLLARADRILRIPLYGRKNSLNVGIAFGIAIADWRRAYEASRTQSEAPARIPTEAHSLTPIGVFHSPAAHPYEARRQGTVDRSGDEGWIELERNRGFEQALDSLAGFDRIWLLYRFHHNENWKPMVMPPRGPRIKRGVFATRSPYRPNPLGLSCVELVRVEGLRVYVRGFDLLDGTPVYDIKPYIPYADAFPAAKTGWLEGLDQASHEVRFSELAERQLAWLEEHGVKQLRGFLVSQLEFDPLDEERKRVTPDHRTDGGKHVHRIAYRTWRADFTLDSSRGIEVLSISSAYSPDERANESDDPYADKATHRLFVAQFPEAP